MKNNLIALVKRDIVFAMTVMKAQLIIGLVLTITFSLDGMKWALMTSIVVPYFLVYGQMAFEERDRSDKLVMTLPVSRSAIALAKYMVIAIYIVTAALLSLCMMTLTYGVGSMYDILQMTLLIMGVGMAYTAIMVPIILKWGVEKSRYIIFVSYILFYIFLTLGRVQEDLMQVVARLNLFWGIVMLIALFCLSMLATLNIYKTKEFR